MTARLVCLCAACGMLCAFGAVLYRAGRQSAENKACRGKEKEYEQTDKIIRAVSVMGRGELLKRLRGGGKK